MQFLKTFRQLGKNLIVRVSDQFAAVEVVDLQPFAAYGNIAHLPIEHGQSDGCVLDEQLQQIFPLP